MSKGVAAEIAENHKGHPVVYPENLTVIGADEPDHPCYDPSRLGEIEQDWIDGLDDQGVQQPPLIWKDDQGRWCVVEGRRRTLGLIKANEKAKREKREPKMMLCVAVTGSAARIAALKVLLNVARKDYSPVAKGEHIIALREKWHFSDKAIALMMGVSVGAIYVWSQIGGAADATKDALKKGAIKQADALEIAKMPRAEQPAAVEKMAALRAGTAPLPEGIADDDAFSGIRENVETKKLKGANARAAAKAIAKGEEPGEPRTRRLTPSMAEKCIAELETEGDTGKLAAKAIRFVLGDAGAWRGFPELLAACKRAGWERPGKE